MSFGRGLLLLGLLVPASAGAQEPGAPSPIELRVDPRDGSVSVRFGGLLAGAELEEATREGLPLRIHVVAELWKDRFFDGQEGRAEWRATVVYDPLERRYLIRTSDASEDRDPPRTVPTLAAAGAELQRRFTVPLRPTSEGTFYYLATVEVETLSLSDLEELQRWLQGELAPAVGGEGD
ncbi:MAG TPA: DUF4390 domain-containing protein, partial [Longimicrobiales bacterium]|nr:DUF4390 domain-containing protein [Longimicrobiales bacterium]